MTPDSDPMRLHVLVSYAYCHSPSHEALLRTLPEEWNLMLDSGAFTSFTQGLRATPVEEYAGFCLRNSERFWRIINLDRIGDPKVSAENLAVMRTHGLNPVPVFQRGDQLGSLDVMFEETGNQAPICVGGISQNVQASAEIAYIRQVVRYATQREIPIHLLGVGGEFLFRIPVYSGDSSTWISAARFGVASLWGGGKFTKFTKSPSGRNRPGYIRPNLERTRLLASYGLTWKDLENPRAWVRTGTAQRKIEGGEDLEPGDDSRVYLANVISWLRMARQLAARGRRYIFAIDSGQLFILKHAWNLEKTNWRTP
jgi:hypothetical protein